VEAAEAERRIAAQAGLLERAGPIAARIVNTDGPLSDTEVAVDVAFRAALAAHGPGAG
jgi:hypothetical protein